MADDKFILTRMIPIEICWHDAESDEGWMDSSEVMEHFKSKLHLCFSVGYLFGFNQNDEIVIYGSKARDALADPFRIPIGMIKHIKRLDNGQDIDLAQAKSLVVNLPMTISTD